MPQLTQVVGGRQSRRSGADDQQPPAGGCGRRRQLPALLDRLVAEKALDSIDADRTVQLGPVTGSLTRVVTDPPHDCREGVVAHQPPPRGLIAAILSGVEPPLDLLPGRAGVVARWQPVDVDGTLAAPAAGVICQAGPHVQCDRKRFVHRSHSSPESRSYRAMLRSASCCSWPSTWVFGGSPNRWAKRTGRAEGHNMGRTKGSRRRRLVPCVSRTGQDHDPRRAAGLLPGSAAGGDDVDSVPDRKGDNSRLCSVQSMVAYAVVAITHLTLSAASK